MLPRSEEVRSGRSGKRSISSDLLCCFFLSDPYMCLDISTGSPSFMLDLRISFEDKSCSDCTSWKWLPLEDASWGWRIAVAAVKSLPLEVKLK